MALQLSISQHQAAVLLPLLQKMIPNDSDEHNKQPFQPEPITSPTSSSNMDLDSSHDQFTPKDLLTKAKKNTKSTKAQTTSRWAIREAAKVTKLWNQAPYLHQISSGKLQEFYKNLFRMCPAMQKCSKKDLRKRLSDSLMNRRQHLRSIKVLSPLKKKEVCSTKRPSVPCVIENQIMPRLQNEIEVNCKSSSSILGHSVEVLLPNSTCIGTGVLLFADANEIFSEVVLRRIHKDIEEDINLYEPTEGKLCFNELEVNDIFRWKSERLRITELKTTVADHLQQYTPLVDKENDDGIMNVDNQDSVEDTTIDAGVGLSEYEIKRQANISRNKAVLQTIMNKPLSGENIQAAGRVDKAYKQKRRRAVNDQNTNGEPARKKIKLSSRDQWATGKENADSQTSKKSRFWMEIDSDSEYWREDDAFSPKLLCEKRTRRPSYKAQQK